MKLDRSSVTFSFLARIRWANLALVLAGLIVLAGLAVWSLNSRSSPQLPPSAAREVEAEFDSADLPAEKTATMEFESPEGAVPKRSRRRHSRRTKGRSKKAKGLNRSRQRHVGVTTSPPGPAPPTYSPTPLQSPPKRGWQQEFSPG